MTSAFELDDNKPKAKKASGTPGETRPESDLGNLQKCLGFRKGTGADRGRLFTRCFSPPGVGVWEEQPASRGLWVRVDVRPGAPELLPAAEAPAAPAVPPAAPAPPTAPEGPPSSPPGAPGVAAPSDPPRKPRKALGTHVQGALLTQEVRPQVLRDYQVDAIQRLGVEFVQGNRVVLLALATGAGKTTVGAEMIRGAVAKGRRVLFIAHRKELIDQASKRLAEFGIEHGVIMGDRHPRANPGLPVQVGSIQTLVKRELPQFDFIIIDEAHHARADSYQAVIDASPTAKVVGLTATPWREDGRGLGDLFKGIVVGATPQQLVERGFLCPLGGFVFYEPDLVGIERKKSGDYQEDQLAERMNKRTVIGDIVTRWKERAGGVKTVVFACNVQHSRDIVAEFVAAGVPAAHVDGETPKAERAAILGRLATGELQVVSNCQILTEGWDLPSLGCVILARPTTSLALFLQMAGRGLRPAPGKERLLIHDHSGSLKVHGLPTWDRDYSLAAPARRVGAQGPSIVKICPDCLGAIPAGSASCPLCGVIFETEPQEVTKVRAEDAAEQSVDELDQERHAQLQRIKRATIEDKCREYLRLQEVCTQRGHNPGWAAHRYRDIFGVWPRFPAGLEASLTPADAPFLGVGP